MMKTHLVQSVLNNEALSPISFSPLKIYVILHALKNLIYLTIAFLNEDARMIVQSLLVLSESGREHY